MFAVSQIMTKSGGGEEKVGGTERKCSLLSLHSFQSLAPICSSKQRAAQGSVATMLCPSWLFSLWYQILLSSAEQGAQEPQPACGADICPLLEPVYLCLSTSSALSFQLASCGSTALHCSPDEPNACIGNRALVLHGIWMKFMEVHNYLLKSGMLG